jgi:hypothetical protein
MLYRAKCQQNAAMTLQNCISHIERRGKIATQSVNYDVAPLNLAFRNRVLIFFKSLLANSWLNYLTGIEPREILHC